MFGGRKAKEQEEEINRLRARVSELESSVASLQTQLRSVEARAVTAEQSLEEAERKRTFTEQDNARLQKRVADLTSADRRAASAEENLRSALTKLSDEICERVVRSVTVASLESSRRQVERTLDYCKSVLPTFDMEAQVRWLDRLKDAHGESVERDRLRQEQALIKERMREELRAERERQKEMERLQREEERIKHELEKLMLKKQTEESALQIEELKQRLEQAHEQSERAKSQAQLTRAGHVYIISNVGSFGEGVYKVGMTRRLEPEERIKELGDASVPFPFDVHMMVSCDDAPTLETELHRLLHKSRVNKVNLRKEFFRMDLETIKAFVEERHGKIEYAATAEALEFNETKLIEERGFDADFNPEFDEEDEPARYGDLAR